jgi:SMC interacting uncharacterized protein involved in chromosome segregation
MFNKGNEEWKLKVEQAEAVRAKVFQMLRNQTSEVGSEMQEAEQASNALLQEALLAKRKLVQEQDDEISALRKQIHDAKTELADIKVSYDFLSHYQKTEREELEKQISALKLEVEDEFLSFEQESSDVKTNFDRSKRIILGRTEKRLSVVRHSAAEIALNVLPAKDRVRSFLFFFLFFRLQL